MNIYDMLETFDDSLRVSTKKIELRASIRDAEKKECGACERWMKCTCPREYNEKGRPKGPSAVSPACELFERTEWETELIAERVKAYEDYIKEATDD